MKALKCVCVYSLVKSAGIGVARGASSLSKVSSIVGSLSLTSDELANKTASIPHARQAVQPATYRFYSVERLPHIALELMVTGEVVHEGGLQADVV